MLEYELSVPEHPSLILTLRELLMKYQYIIFVTRLQASRENTEVMVNGKVRKSKIQLDITEYTYYELEIEEFKF